MPLTPSSLADAARSCGLPTRVRSDASVEVDPIPGSARTLVFHFDPDGGFWVDASGELHPFDLYASARRVLVDAVDAVLDAEFWFAVSRASNAMDRVGDVRGRPSQITTAVSDRIEDTKNALDRISTVLEAAQAIASLTENSSRSHNA